MTDEQIIEAFSEHVTMWREDGYNGAAIIDETQAVAIGRDIIAALPGWRSMDSAPKDGTKIDVWSQSFKIRAGKLLPDGLGRRVAEAFWGKPYYGDEREWEDQWVYYAGRWTDPIESDETSITHWMHLPVPPSTPGEKPHV